MRKYAAFYNSDTEMWSILSQDENDFTPEVWYLHLANVGKHTEGDEIKKIVRLLNESGN